MKKLLMKAVAVVLLFSLGNLRGDMGQIDLIKGKNAAAYTSQMPDPITGEMQTGRSCLVKDSSGNCIEWKVLAYDKNRSPLFFAERVCKSPADGECTATVVRGNDVATCKAAKGAACSARVAIK